jgi:hypothetical protein
MGGVEAGIPPGLDAATPACQLVPERGVLATTCGMAGTGDTGVPCATVADCAPGYGCALTAPNVATCRPYCCTSLVSCDQFGDGGTSPRMYCATLGLGEAPQLEIPVCIDATDCDLITGAPCTNGQACAIVRADGTRSCVTPGKGTLGQPCDCTAGLPCTCAAGYTCSWSDNTCLLLCETSEKKPCGSNAYCQGGVVQFPPGVGYCVSY